MKLSLAVVLVLAALQHGRADAEIHLIPDGYVGDQYFVGTRAQLLSRDEMTDRRRVAAFLESEFVCQ